jgi:Ca-activated chloride channel family protein
MTFVQPIFLYSLIFVLPLVAAFVIWAGRRQKAALAQLGNPALVQRLSATVNWRGRRWQTALWFVALTMLMASLARPQWGSETHETKQQGIEVMVALDVSNSMLAQDIKPDRLSRAKLEIADLMNRLGGNEIGLVLFSAASFVQFPLTNDYGTARSFLENARPTVISKQGTNIGDAIRTALAGFDLKRNSQKVIVLVTDGENLEGDALAMVEQAAQQGVKLYTIGFGSPEGEPIPELNDRGEITGYKKDEQGQVVMSRLDEATLQKIAEIGGGKYYRAATDGSELAALAAELDSLQKGELSTQLETWGIERFQSFLWLALAALVVMELIPDRILNLRLRRQESKAHNIETLKPLHP